VTNLGDWDGAASLLKKGGGAVAAPQVAIDKVRASRDGHAYHEAWAARTALELLVPTTTLTAITLEGFSSEDSPDLSSDAVEIADLVRYRGGINLHTARAVETVQFKYSIARADVPMRAPDIRKTLAKFATTERDAHQVLGPECRYGVESAEREFIRHRVDGPNQSAYCRHDRTRDLKRSRLDLMTDCQIEPNSPDQRNSLAICWVVQTLHENRFAEFCWVAVNR
jgi:hypothetical protein